MQQPLRQNQKEMCRWLWDRGLSGLNASEPGMGKSRETLELIRQGIKHGKVKRVLVVAPVLLARTVWPEEIALWTPEISWRLLWTAQPKATLKVGEETIQITSYETARILLKRGTIRPGQFDTLVLDESSKCKDRTTQITKALLKFVLDSRNTP